MYVINEGLKDSECVVYTNFLKKKNVFCELFNFYWYVKEIIVDEINEISKDNEKIIVVTKMKKKVNFRQKLKF